MDTKKPKPGVQTPASQNDKQGLFAVEASPPVDAVSADPWSRRVPPAGAGGDDAA